MLALGDLSAARLLFGRAAQAGDVGAMLALGGTYDPTSSTDPQPRAEDLATAARWYRLAAASGSAEAASRLQQINQHATK